MTRERCSPGLRRRGEGIICEIVEITPEIRERAIEVRPASVRSLDAIHVATALVAGLSGFASFDARQRIAAEEMGLKLVAGT